MNSNPQFLLERDTIKKPHNAEIANYCKPFSCGDKDLDEFFVKDALLYDTELLGRTYVWIDLSHPENILAFVTLANDSVKLKLISSSALNRLQRGVSNAKRA